ncbi:hypothetical protein BS50DRAFT_277746 [Corynespora cassiicola Philippines]|uniref:Uncharacterized protein n=1 Tax=Corynespora cassiicola Philippines TaxID=1448308 RepID=A0A2T2P0P4_CORCC|nr:hypothetical protein BS50DRAFT_277746 [Corynespora cassiicola Philippines]
MGIVRPCSLLLLCGAARASSLLDRPATQLHGLPPKAAPEPTQPSYLWGGYTALAWLFSGPTLPPPFNNQTLPHRFWLRMSVVNISLLWGSTTGAAPCPFHMAVQVVLDASLPFPFPWR